MPEIKKRLEDLANDLGVKNNIIFTNEVSEEEKYNLLNLSKIFIFPSEWEAFGIVVLEAMNFGNVVISTRTEGGKYLINENENGFLFDYQNLFELENKLKNILSKPNLIEKIKKNNIAKTKQYYWQDIAKNLEKYYKNLI